MKRRDFIKAASVVTPLIGMFPTDLSGISRMAVPKGIEKRSLGKTGVMLSMIGFGGIVVKDSSPADASAMVKYAIDSGINYFDVAPSYGDAEVKLGPALEPYRESVFLACKTTQRTKKESRAELENSLKVMRTGHFDLYQHHAVTALDEVKAIFSEGGSMETFLEARKEGKIRFIGFSAHSVEAAMAMMDNFDFDTILFPVNYATWHAGNFGPQVLARAAEKKMGILALKAMARGPWKEDSEKSRYPKCWYEPLSSKEDIRMGLNFTLSHPVTSAIPPGEADLFKEALAAAAEFRPLKKQEADLIKEKALAGDPLFRFGN